MTNWMLVSAADNFERSRATGFTVAGMKSRHRKKAERVRPGDRVLFYLTGVQAFGGTATVTSEYVEDHAPLWVSKKDNEDYPFRFRIQPNISLSPGQFVTALSLLPSLIWVRKWPAEHWHLAFQGNVHMLSDEDFATIETALREAETALREAAPVAVS